MEEEKSVEEFYFAYVECENCRHEVYVSIPKNTDVKTHIRRKSELCENCGVRLTR